MVIHPPMLYLGYVGFTVPFAFALGRADHEVSRREMDSHHPPLDHGHLGISHLRNLPRRALGLFRARLGRLLGWDPVENASLMPWLVGTAFLHSVMMQEKARHAESLEHVAGLRHFLAGHSRNILTRSGIISSVHAFAQSSIGSWFAWFLSITFAVFVFFLLQKQRSPAQRTQTRIAHLPRVEFPVQ